MLQAVSYLDSAGHPPQPGVPGGMDVEQMFLYTAWLHGLTPASRTLRYSLFSCVGAYIANNAEDTLQGALERSPYWERANPANYALQDRGVKEILNMYGEKSPARAFPTAYEFTRTIERLQVTARVQTSPPEVIPFIGGTAQGTETVVNMLRDHGVVLPGQTTSLPRKILNWVLENNDYRWESFPKHGVQSPN